MRATALFVRKMWFPYIKSKILLGSRSHTRLGWTAKMISILIKRYIGIERQTETERGRDRDRETDRKRETETK